MPKGPGSNHEQKPKKKKIKAHFHLHRVWAAIAIFESTRK